ncbi:MAG: hypothetical protein R3A51_06355 [Nannocystaceae bacterium]
MTDARRWGRAARRLGIACLLTTACGDGEEASTTAGTTDASTSDGPTSDASETTAGSDASDTDTGTTGDPNCYSTRDFFVDEVWAPLMSKVCLQCHDPTGVAAEVNAKFLLLPPVYPGFIDANLENIKELHGYSFEGVPLLLAKPSALAEHGGGKVLPEGSGEYEALASLLEQLDAPVECPPDAGGDLFADVGLLSPTDTLRKATLHLTGRLPTDDELAAVEDGGEEALALALDELMTEEAFYERLMELFNDVLLTDQFIANSTQTRAVALLNNDQWPNRTPFIDNVMMLSAEERRRINKAVAREPLHLIKYIVREERPFTELLTADYTVFTPDSAWLYGVDITFDDPGDPSELQVGQLATANNGGAGWPHAGVLSSPMWLNRYETTETNRNRHRSRMIYLHFLATDVLELASQAIDPDAGSSIFNPTRNNPVCSKCHKGVDPIAGAFQMFHETDQERLLDPPQWHEEMYSPGFGNEVMPPDEFADGLQWLAAHLANDPRFGLAMTYHVFTGLTGHTPQRYPTDTNALHYDNLLAAWQAQDAYMRGVAATFVGDDHNLKTMIKEIILGPYYRAGSLEKPPDEARAVELQDIGTGRLSTPELLARKIAAVTGVRWDKSNGDEYLLTDYLVLYGGMDSDELTERLGDVNHIMSQVAARMANEVACQATAFDFSKPAGERLLFPLVELTDTADVSEAAIRDNLVHLHRRVLGEELAADDPEITRAFALFSETQSEGAASVASDEEGSESINIVSTCRATVDPNTGVDLPMDQQIIADESYSVRAWMAVVSYLLGDYRFLYE